MSLDIGIYPPTRHPPTAAEVQPPSPGFQLQSRARLLHSIWLGGLAPTSLSAVCREQRPCLLCQTSRRNHVGRCGDLSMPRTVFLLSDLIGLVVSPSPLIGQSP